MTTEENNSFRLYVPLTKSKNNEETKYELNEDGTLDIEGIASTTNEDLHGDVILPSAIKSMKKQLLTSNKNLHGDHRYGLFDGLLGSIRKVLDSDKNTLKIGSTILSRYAPDILEMMNIGVNLGLSIGGNPVEYDINQNGGWKIKDIELHEISLTSMPANMDTLGTVTVSKGVVEGNCLGGICSKLIKNMKKEREEEGILMNKNNNNQQASDVDKKIKSAVDELWAEKEKGLADSITESISIKVKDIVQEEFKKLNNTNNEPTNNNNNNNQQANSNNTTKALQKDEITNIISQTIEETYESFEKKFFKNLNDNRNPEPKFDVKQQAGDNTAKSTHKKVKTYTTTETAKILLEKQRNNNPIMNAVMDNLKE